MRPNTTAQSGGKDRHGNAFDAERSAEDSTPPVPTPPLPTAAATPAAPPRPPASTAVSASAEPPPTKNAAGDAPGVAARDPLLAAICHDLRAPLAAVMMGANFVLQTTPEEAANGRSRRVLQAILRSCKQMERLVRDFGDLSEIEGNAVVLRPGVADAAEILEMAAEGARPNAIAHSVDIEVKRPDKPILLRSDRERILRALNHIVENASRFAPDGSNVILSASEDANEVKLTISDSGPGLSAETLANLYDRSWHGKRADRVGAGLGLAIARGFVTAHGGRIDVASKPGATTFTLILPKERPSTPPPSIV